MTPPSVGRVGSKRKEGEKKDENQTKEGNKLSKASNHCWDFYSICRWCRGRG